MSQAIMTQQDAITGYWNPEEDVVIPPTGSQASDDLLYLTADRRHQILVAEMGSRFSVAKIAGGATVSVEGIGPVCQVTKPAFDMKYQLNWVRAYGELRSDRIPEIQAQIGGILPFFAAAHPLNGFHKKHTALVLGAVQALTIGIHMQVKHYCWMHRPSDYASQVQPIIDTPDHSAYPSGHSTEAFVLATVFHYLVTGELPNEALAAVSAPMVYRVAHRIAVNRTVAGVHFPVDNAAGAVLGAALGATIVGIATSTEVEPQSMFWQDFSGGFSQNEDFTLDWMKTNLSQLNPGVPLEPNKTPLFARHFAEARAEWP